MSVDVGSNCHSFGYKHLLFVLYSWPTSIHISGGSTFLAAGVGLLPVKFRGSHTLNSLAPIYWTSTDLTNILSIRTLKLLVTSLVPTMIPSNPAPSVDPKALISLSILLAKTTSILLICTLSKWPITPECSIPLYLTKTNSVSNNISAQFIHQCFRISSHQCIQ